MRIIRLGLDTSKHVFQVHGVDEADQPVLRRQVRRGEMEKVFAKLPATRIGLEACGASHHWARVLRGLGHEVTLMPPQYVKPYVKRGKNDAIDAEAICEAMSRPGMRFVAVKSAEDQAGLMLLSVRDLLVKQRTMLINAMRGHAAEFGVIAAKGPVKIAELLQRAHAPEAGVPALVLELLNLLSNQLDALEARDRGQRGTEIDEGETEAIDIDCAGIGKRKFDDKAGASDDRGVFIHIVAEAGNPGSRRLGVGQ